MRPQTFHELADEQNDIHDHDELHAAGAVLKLMRGQALRGFEIEYIQRWLKGLEQ